MYNSLDSSDILFPGSGSRLLSESMLPSISSSHTGLGGDDLSISELSLADRTPVAQKPFSLLAPTESSLTRPENDHGHDDDLNQREDEEDTDDEEKVEQNKRHAAKLREEKLQSDIFILRKLNASFAMFNEALRDTGSANQRVAEHLEQTDALLNKYIGILSKSEEFTRLIFDEQWQGADADEEALQRERLAAQERTRRETEERAFAAQREEERRQREEQERIEQEEKERIERERKERMAARGGIRGVRGTKASMRGVRGTTRTAPSGTRRGATVTAQTSDGTNSSKLPMPSTGARSSSSGPGLSRRT
ncbi:hypothetical protein D9615_002246 [Tricholomella constricta]|uniref:DASH complex subunit DUO1 n=1 Tax=Tricholomella constricta TaxID=117010 RepID=A0A8H5HLT4_9AGAR|nr:hypothetical protein D9615_002246 [Tricholomella constricta]